MMCYYNVFAFLYLMAISKCEITGAYIRTVFVASLRGLVSKFYSMLQATRAMQPSERALVKVPLMEPTPSVCYG